jgi:hypothetical protein
MLTAPSTGGSSTTMFPKVKRERVSRRAGRRLLLPTQPAAIVRYGASARGLYCGETSTYCIVMLQEVLITPVSRLCCDVCWYVVRWYLSRP